MHTAAQKTTGLGRSVSLSEKELKEARTRSQIIAAQLTVPSSSSSRGVQLFNRRRQRVDAFTLVSIGGGQGEEGGHNESWNAPEPPSLSTPPRDRKHSADGRSERSKPRSGGAQDPGGFTSEEATQRDMDQAGEAVCETRHREDGVHESHFLPVRDKDEETPGELSGEAGQRGAPGGISTAAIADQSGEEGAELNKACECLRVPNGCHGNEVNGKACRPVSKQPAITNRTARPFLSPTTVGSAESTGPLITSSSTPHLPASQEPPRSQINIEPPSPASSRPVFSPPPPAPSYPTPPLPAAMSAWSSFTSHAPRPTAMSPPPGPTYYAPSTAPCPMFVPQLLSERRVVTSFRTGLLDEGRFRRVNRKSMFTFQEKPKLSPNPELLSLVQGADEMRKVRGQPESQQEEEMLALGAEASNFLAKDESGVEEALVPEWASTLKSSRTRARVEHTPEQALTDASGRGAELFARRQSRMERYVHEMAPGRRSPSPTHSLPPSWAYPSSMPGRVKAIVHSSNISAEISKTLQDQKASNKSIPAKVPVPTPAPVPDSPAMENGCSKVELELSRHQPYQLNSSLFILNPIKDPMSTLPRAAPPRKSMVTGFSFPQQTSLPSSPNPTQHAYRSAHFFSPPMTPVGMASGGAASPMSGMASPRSAVQTPKPTFSAKKAGIVPQVTDESPVVTPPSSSSTPTPWSSSLPRCPSRDEKPPCAPWSPSSQRSSLVTSPPPQTIHKPVTFSPTPRPFQSLLPSWPTATHATTTPVSPPWQTTCQSPIALQDTKASHRLLAKNIINAAKRKNSPSPGALSSHSLPMSPLSSTALSFEPKLANPGQSHSLAVRSPTFTSPPPTPTRAVRSPLRLYTTRSLTDSDASLESEDSGVRSPGLRSYNTCPRAWTGSLRVKRGGVSEDL
ncbi:synaptopodin isoform X2 [Electrophorus electricus]|uniref:synaptopodin isoform X2 n=1 Tax=Electrophorus electricus TaxID=8005 RepID=UPI0015D03CFF|nr:synaptopodin isoform X2 [Electrophorus electricus]